ncbi:hypothetical protein AUP42_18125 [Thalassospira lucentensis]|uniref:Uncharacterized protein n=1 Tax=Thalassospira lucentensis TaxID=168935 RepID=A0A154L5W7_9PROT|nr:hypothetical protein [Thalassospira lucentensis]KZB65345.1 hypothetical protein AUP42_18125 [Thalassospira lucentensis]
MTLCAVWKHENTLHLASDSRVNLGAAGRADIAIKIGREHYSIYAPYDRNFEKVEIASGDLAFCYAGSGLGAIFMKESLSDILNELQIVPGEHEASLSSVVKVVFEAYKVISIKLAEILQSLAFVHLIVAGFCRHSNCFRAFQMLPIPFDSSASSIQEYQMEEVLVGNSNYLFFGSGKGEAEKEFQKQYEDGLSLRIIRTFKNIIKNNLRDDVGGSLQYGRFEQGVFKTFAEKENDTESQAGVRCRRGALDMRAPELERLFSFEYPWVILDEI